jgi:hypothetical protein
MFNSGIKKVYILTQYQAYSLNKHIKESWDKWTGLGEFYDTISPETGSMSDQWFKGTADAIFQNLKFIESAGAEYVVIFGGDHIYKMELSQIIEYHRINKADLTIAALEVSAGEAKRFGVLCVDDDFRVVTFMEKPERPAAVPGRDTCFASMGNYIFSTKKLIDVLKSGKRIYDDLDFGKHIIPMMRSCGPQDCNDNDPKEHPDQIWYKDADNDGYSSGDTIVQCSRPASYKITSEFIATSGDCNDSNSAVNPSAKEVCNGIDDNCNQSIDEGIYLFGGFGQPINSDGSSIFKAGSTIPVKLTLTECSGQSISTATVTIAVYKITDTVLGTVEELLPDSSGNANTGNLFRYDPLSGQYIYNLSTKGLTGGTYTVRANPDDGSSSFVNLSLK